MLIGIFRWLLRSVFFSMICHPEITYLILRETAMIHLLLWGNPFSRIIMTCCVFHLTM